MTKSSKVSKPRKARSPPFAEYEDWSEAKFFSFLRSGLRAKWSRWPPKYIVLANAKRPYEGENKRQKFEYQCNSCKLYHPQKEISVDHIEPAGTLRSLEDLPEFCRRLFVGVDKLQCLCDSCHAVKTAEERKARTTNKEEEHDD